MRAIACLLSFVAFRDKRIQEKRDEVSIRLCNRPNAASTDHGVRAGVKTLADEILAQQQEPLSRERRAGARP